MAPGTGPAPHASETATEAMARYGIRCVPVDVFHWGGYRYSTLKDATNAAKRAAGA